MNALNFTPEEVTRIARCCRWLEFDGTRPWPAYYLREFIAARLKSCDPELVAAVRGLCDDGMDALAAELRERQALAKALVFG
jgi:hypothetical protein